MERIWIYQADRFLNEEEQEQVTQTLAEFTSQWKAHGKKLTAFSEVRYGLFVILMVDDSVEMPSGCSIDKSVYLMKELEERLKVGFFDRLKVAYRPTPDAAIEIVSKEAFEQLISEGKITPETIVFNNLVGEYGDLATKWEVPASQSWHARVFGLAHV